jgi:long-chain acyl-CoA synthetase
MKKVWLAHYPPGVPTNIDPQEYGSLWHLLEERCKQFSNKVAFSNYGTSLSYSQLENLSAHFASYLLKEQALPFGSRIGIMLPNLLQYPVACFGALRAGYVVVNINPLYTAHELETILMDADLRFLLVLEPFAHIVEAVLNKGKVQQVPAVMVTSLGELLGFKGLWMNAYLRWVKKMVPVFNKGTFLSWKEAFKKPVDKKALSSIITIQPDDMAFLQYTGGTTGVTKAAVLTHRNMVANVLQVRSWVGPIVKESKGVIITALPLYHIFSLTANALSFFSLGIENVLITNPRDIDGFIAVLKKKPFAFITGVNTLFVALLQHPLFKTLSFSSLKIALGGGMGVQAHIAAQWEECTGVPLLGAYGLTEASPAVSICPFTEDKERMARKTGSVGLPLPSTQVMVWDADSEEECPLGTTGECWVKGPQVMQGYWHHPKETEAVFQDGWLYTGDLIKMDEDGYIWIVDRKKDVILVSGFNVYPNEVEEVLANHPKVKEVAVVGVTATEEAMDVEQVKAFVVPHDLSLTAEELVAHCRCYLTQYKVPKAFEFLQALPRSPLGKILKRALTVRNPPPPSE